LEDETLYTNGSVIGTSSAKITYLIQSEYLKKSGLKIPLLLMHDAIHGYKTIFPIPLGLSCTWDEKIVETVAKKAVTALRAAGIHVNFSLLVDLVREWGRVMESFGGNHLLSEAIGQSLRFDAAAGRHTCTRATLFTIANNMMTVWRHNY
jgi:beta-glucosidase